MRYQSKIYLLLIMLIWTTSCSDLLDLQPEASVSDEGVISDKKTSLAALYGIYDNIQNSYTPTLTAFNLAGDNVISYATPTIIVPDRNAEDNGGAPFAAFYVTINRANFIIKRVPEVVDNQLTDAERDQIVGEAYFLRAFAYFDLARFYGGVQIVTEPTERIDTHKGTKRSTLAETYNQVLADLDKAEELISGETDRSRATKFAVYALKARFFLYTEQWEQAEEYASKTISNSNFSLVKPFTTFFTDRLSKESIFEVVYTAVDASTYWRSWLSTEDGGNQTYVPEPSLIADLLDPAKGGARKNILKQSVQEPELYAVQLYGKKDGTSSLFALRIAEQYLIRAEARTKKSNPDIEGAVSDLLEVQSRAEVTPLFTHNAVTTVEDVLVAIEEERRLELAFEGHRFTDLIRTNRAAEVLGSYNPLLKEPYQWVFPIPASSVEKDPDLEQNKGY
ncbi:RagB/SusD family nutrient uptake outer membrane protein [Sphingobacterium chuzhouense]|uniref:RagB/SusD family nutrient uptake outer membrane protein n=1 Tax=Sphingobacterium chuzhouense TaxID=1742264 RepID=A0ABR7XVP7_9SPHI|nr:RagB/SusD family nutrient uptake outer membrane protein [Sphingobacterium chuzhouense]MBD1423129.1 RagB/SusD family nutrient uptake outer membrane protein [Sphingobacterium chuzhouense]